MFDAHLSVIGLKNNKHVSCSMQQLKVLVIQHFVHKFHLFQIPNTQFELFVAILDVFQAHHAQVSMCFFVWTKQKCYSIPKQRTEFVIIIKNAPLLCSKLFVSISVWFSRFIQFSESGKSQGNLLEDERDKKSSCNKIAKIRINTTKKNH